MPGYVCQPTGLSPWMTRLELRKHIHNHGGTVQRGWACPSHPSDCEITVCSTLLGMRCAAVLPHEPTIADYPN